MVDIIIPAYNAHDTIKKTLFSILNQNILNKLNVYIIDDHSIVDYRKEYNFFKDKMNINLIRLKKNMGPGYARQVGLDKSKSNYVMFIDSDDAFFDSYSIEFILSCIESNDYDLVAGHMIENRYGEILDYVTGTDTLHAKIYKRKFLEDNNIKFPYIYNSEDLAFNLLIFLNNPKFTCTNEYIYAYNRREKSLTGEDYYENKHIKFFCQTIDWVIKKAIKGKKNNEKIGELILFAYSYLYYYFTYKSNINDKTLKYSYDLLSYYFEYSKYVCESRKKEIIEFFYLNRGESQFYISFNEFINLCVCNSEEKIIC